MRTTGSWRKDPDSGKWLAFVSGEELPAGSIITVARRDRSSSNLKIISTSRKLGKGFLYSTKAATAVRAQSVDLTVYARTAPESPADSRVVFLDELDILLGLEPA